MKRVSSISLIYKRYPYVRPPPGYVVSVFMITTFTEVFYDGRIFKAAYP